MFAVRQNLLSLRRLFVLIALALCIAGFGSAMDVEPLGLDVQVTEYNSGGEHGQLDKLADVVFANDRAWLLPDAGHDLPVLQAEFPPSRFNTPDPRPPRLS